MKAITYDRYGSADVLRHAEVAPPTAGEGEVLIRVRAASINHADLFMMWGRPTIMRLGTGLRRPRTRILGRDIAGTVAAVGSRVTSLRVGDEVFGEVNQRGFAEYVTAPAAHLAVKPSGVSFEQAATLPIAGTTALTAQRVGGVTAGHRVLVNGASGGVGTFAVQLAVSLGADVTGVCSTRNVDLVRSLGAHHVIDYTRSDITSSTTRFDVILDLAGNHPLTALRRLLVPGGVLLASSGSGGRVLGPLPRLLAVVATGPFTRQRLKVLTVKRSVDDLNHLAALVAEGRITPAIQATYPLSEAPEAIRMLETEHARGKVVLTLTPQET